jgi:predicted alpha/beta superfamily hydrolase
VSEPVLLPLPVEIPDGVSPPSLWSFPEVAGPGEATREILVALPPHYDEHPRTRYRVIYLQDGQNCFDPATSYAGHWSLLETMARHATHPVILVGVPNLGHGRLREYSPFDDVVRGPGEGAEYLRYLVRTVKPLVDSHFRTKPGRDSTGIAGSSMGGLLALHALIAEARTFSAAWVMSPALWYAGGAIFDWMARQPGPVGQLWLDTGMEEGEDQLDEVRRMRDLLVQRGWRLDDALHYHEDPEGDHDEASWGRRVDEKWRRLVGMLE